MATAAELRTGDKVLGPIGAFGTVVNIKDGTAIVEYRERGQSWIGTYSPEWFSKYAELLKKITPG